MALLLNYCLHLSFNIFLLLNFLFFIFFLLFGFFFFNYLFFYFFSNRRFASGVIRMPTRIQFDEFWYFIVLFTNLTILIRNYSLNMIALQFVELRHLLIHNHLVGQQENMCIFGVSSQSCSEGVQDQCFAEEISMLADKG